MKHRVRSQRSESTILILFLKSEIEKCLVLSFRGVLRWARAL
jgi:hypothetical protein